MELYTCENSGAELQGLKPLRNRGEYGTRETRSLIQSCDTNVVARWQKSEAQVKSRADAKLLHKP